MPDGIDRYDFRCLQCDKEYSVKDSPSDIFCSEICDGRWRQQKTRGAFGERNAVLPPMPAGGGPGVMYGYALWLARQAEQRQEAEEEEESDGV